MTFNFLTLVSKSYDTFFNLFQYLNSLSLLACRRILTSFQSHLQPILTTNFRIDIRFADELQSIETNVKKISEPMRII